MIDWGWYFHVRPTYLFYKYFIITIVFDDLWATMDTKFKVNYKIWISLLLTRLFEIRRRLFNLGSSLKRLLVVSRKRQITYWLWENTPGSTNSKWWIVSKNICSFSFSLLFSYNSFGIDHQILYSWVRRWIGSSFILHHWCPFSFVNLFLHITALVVDLEIKLNL